MIDTNTFKQRLDDERVTLEEQLATVGQPSSSNPGTWEAVQKETTQEADMHDQADHLDEYQENRAILDVLHARYKEVTDALERVEKGSYGTCEISGEPIEEERLDADPTARTCIAEISQTA